MSVSRMVGNEARAEAGGNRRTNVRRRREAREAEILDAARAAFLEHGYAGVSMDRVAAQAHASKTTLYTRFPSKEALFAATIARECEQRGMRFSPESLDGLPAEEALRLIGRRFLGLLLSLPAIRVQQIVMGEAPRFPELARIYYDAGPAPATASVAGYLARAAARGELAVPDPAHAAAQLLHGIKGASCFQIELGLRPLLTEAEQEAQVAAAVHMFLQGALPR